MTTELRSTLRMRTPSRLHAWWWCGVPPHDSFVSDAPLAQGQRERLPSSQPTYACDVPSEPQQRVACRGDGVRLWKSWSGWRSSARRVACSAWDWRKGWVVHLQARARRSWSAWKNSGQRVGRWAWEWREGWVAHPKVGTVSGKTHSVAKGLVGGKEGLLDAKEWVLRLPNHHPRRRAGVCRARPQPRRADPLPPWRRVGRALGRHDFEIRRLALCLQGPKLRVPRVTIAHRCALCAPCTVRET